MVVEDLKVFTLNFHNSFYSVLSTYLFSVYLVVSHYNLQPVAMEKKKSITDCNSKVEHCHCVFQMYI